MQKKKWIVAGIAVIAAVSFVFIAGISPEKTGEKENATCSTQKIKKCDAGTNKNESGDLMDIISRQFLSISTLIY